MSARHWRPSLSIVTAAAVVVIGARDAGAQTVRQVITRAELEAAGWTRLSELVFSTRAAARTTVDGITVQGNVTGTPTWSMAPGRDEWRVIVDEQPVPVGFAGLSVIDLLPVSLTQLDSVVVQRTPGIAAGQFASGGVLRLYTHRGEPGTHGSISHYSGNEVGDPGPFTFTPDVTPNIDNSGPFHQARLGHGATAWDVDVAVRRWTDNLTDRRIAARHEAAAAPDAPELWVRQLAPTLRAGIAGLGGRHDVHAATAQLRGTFFVPSVRADQSLATRLTFGGISGNVAAGLPAGVAYRFSASQLEAQPYGAPLPSTFAHERRELAGGLSMRRAAGQLSLEAGAAFAHHALVSAPALRAESFRDAATGATLFVDAAMLAPWLPRLQAVAGHGLDGVRGALLLSAAPRVDDAVTLHLSLSGDVRAYGDDGAWIDLELFGLGPLATGRRATLVADAELRRAFSNGIALGIGTAARRETGLRLLSSDTTALDPLAPPAVSPALSLTSGELRVTLDLPVAGPVIGGASYRLGRPLGGWDEARDAAASLPRHLVDAAVVLTPFLDIRVRPAVHLASATHWIADGTGRFVEVPAVVRLDLSFEKWFFARHLRAQLLARNLLNDVERYHPLGADFRLRVFAGATLSF